MAGRGVALLSACSHAGIVNACLFARECFPDLPIELVLGGFHLAGKAMEICSSVPLVHLLSNKDV